MRVLFGCYIITDSHTVVVLGLHNPALVAILEWMVKILRHQVFAG